MHTPGRITQGVKVSPLFPANTNRHGAKTVFYLMVLRSSDYRSCTFPPMNQMTNDFDAASSVEQNNQGRARGLGRVPRPTSKLQSPS
ncbi:hypothetical protein AVEN_151380-1 [Araneus ventricosus]|uniref:Uncharacterized protein n=1 Tax=Araneus ventricosus TaxID=182803 RepID=A0A4Y2C903_ARAVE|nr:hypothetical protein AVEN_151380-1 [Araneus ventricosus]